MALTGYSTVFSREVDVEQLIVTLMSNQGNFDITNLKEIPIEVREIVHNDISCPSCFAKGAEIVNGAKSNGKLIRQAYFRFTNPGHGRFCDYVDLSDPKSTPENLVSFGKANNNITRTIRELVCSAIELQIVDQQKIRNMRQWFYDTKNNSSLYLEIAPDLPKRLIEWEKELSIASYASGLPFEVKLTKQIAKLPGFNWRQEAMRQLYKENESWLAWLNESQWRFLRSYVARAMSLIQKHQGREISDPTSLQIQYQKTIDVAVYVASYLKFKEHIRHDIGETKYSYLVAFTALLLYVNDWDTTKALEDFSRIVNHQCSDLSLGNVIGLNPFHDYQAWNLIKLLQTFPSTITNVPDLKAELTKKIQYLQSQYL